MRNRNLYQKDYLLPKVQPSESSKIKLEERTCACGCGCKFSVMGTSKQVYRSTDCHKIKTNRNHRWKTTMNYMVKG